MFALDRLGRSLRDLLLLLDDLAASGCSVISLRESIDLSTPTGRLLVHLIASLAEFERELIRDRVRAGFARVKATGRTRSGRAVGRPRRDVDLQAVHQLRAEGRSWRQVAVARKVPRGAGLRRPWLKTLMRFQPRVSQEPEPCSGMARNLKVSGRAVRST